MTLFFFFQAEDGIRDVAVTGVQTCALPILSRERISRALVFNRAAGFRSLAPHRRSSPAVSATHANRAVFSRLEKPPGAARLAPAGAKIRAPAAGADGIHPRLFDRSAVRDRSVRRKAPPLL